MSLEKKLKEKQVSLGVEQNVNIDSEKWIGVEKRSSNPTMSRGIG